MHTHRSLKSVIFWRSRYHRRHNTLSHVMRYYVTATLKSTAITLQTLLYLQFTCLLTYLLTYLLQEAECFTEKLTSSQLVKKFPFYGTWRFITAFTWARHLSLFWASLIQSMPPLPLYLKLLNKFCTVVSPCGKTRNFTVNTSFKLWNYSCNCRTHHYHGNHHALLSLSLYITLLPGVWSEALKYGGKQNIL